MRIKPFHALCPRPDLAAQVASVPYDTVDTAEARALAEGNPLSFLRVVRPEIALPPGTTAEGGAHAEAAKALERFQHDAVLVREKDTCCYVYREIMGDHVQVGVVACCHIDEYEANAVRKHERTRADKEEDRSGLVSLLRAHTGPVFLAYQDSPAIDREIEVAQLADPFLDFTSSDGVRHTLWRVSDRSDGLVAAFAALPVCYVADGHHRLAAAARTAAAMRAADPGASGDAGWNWFLAAFVPASRLKILPYNRCVLDLNGMDEKTFLDAVGQRFRLSVNAPPQPIRPGNISMYLSGQWYGLSWDGAPDQGGDSLDVSVLQDCLLEPILGIKDPRTDTRIEFVGGIRGVDGLVGRVDGSDAAVAFSMHPVRFEQVMQIADAGGIMPPKSTWFEPKLRSGLVVHTF